MKNLLLRLTSRKFWLTVAAFITFVVNEQYTEAVGVVVAYLGVEGAADALNSRSVVVSTKNTVSQNDDELSGDVTTGNKVGAPLFDEEIKED